MKTIIDQIIERLDDLAQKLEELEKRISRLPKICECGWHLPSDEICQNPHCNQQTNSKEVEELKRKINPQLK
jgi:archaellum component FlaC